MFNKLNNPCVMRHYHLLFRLFALVAALSCALGASADTENYYSGGVYYNLYDDYYGENFAENGDCYAEVSGGPTSFRYSGSVTISSSVYYNGKTYPVKAIGNNAFSGCTGLTSVTIPNSVELICLGAFYGCTGLTSLTIPASVRVIRLEAFNGCTNLTSVTCMSTTPPVFSDPDSEFDDILNPFSDITYTKATLFVPRGCKSAYQAADWWKRFTNIQERSYDFIMSGFYYVITGSNTVQVTSFNEAYVPSSGTLSIPVSVRNNNTNYNVTSIGYRAFYNCDRINKILISNTITSVGTEAFKDCDGLQVVQCQASTPPTMGSNVFDSDTYNENAVLLVYNASMSAYKAATGWKNFNYVEPIYDFVLNGIYYNITGNSTVEVTYGQRDFWNGTYNVNTPTYRGNLTIPSSVTHSGKTYTVTAIGDHAFDFTLGNDYNPDAEALKSVTIPNTVDRIGTYAFAQCSGLTSMTIPTPVTVIGSSAFWGCSNLASVELSSSLKTIGFGAFMLCESLASVTIPNSVNYIGAEAFTCTALTEVTIPNSVTSILSYTFNACSSLKSVTIGTSVTSIQDRAFSQCPLLSDVTCEATTPPTMSNSNVFDAATYSNATLKVPRDRVYYYQNANWWKNFTHIQEKSYDFVLNGIYYNITSVNTVEVTYKDENYNSYSGKVLSIPSSVSYGGTTYTVNSIGKFAFNQCSNLESVRIPATVVGIGRCAFYGTSLICVTCLATTPPSLSSDVFDNNMYNNAILMLPKDAYNKYQSANGWRNFWNKVFYSYDFVVNGIYYTITGTNTVEVAYNDNTYSGSVTIPSSVTYGGKTYSVTAIGDWAFYQCSALTSVTIPNIVTTIGNGSFVYCSALTSVVIPNSVTTIDMSAFALCYALREVTLGSGLTYIYGGAFYQCPSLISVICLATTPPTMEDSGVFDDATYSSATLKVPRDRMYYYRNANWWKNFSSIVANVQPGDVDGDGQVGISDVADLIDLILSGTATIESCPAADVDGDGRISIADVSELIDILLGN